MRMRMRTVAWTRTRTAVWMRSWDPSTHQVVYLGSLKESLDSGPLKALLKAFLKRKMEDSSS
jgi:hypothetical protein